MDAIASHITSLTIVYSTVYSGSNQRKRQCSASLAFVRAIHRSPVNCPHKWPVTRKMLSFDDAIMEMKYAWSGTCFPESIILYKKIFRIEYHSDINHWRSKENLESFLYGPWYWTELSTASTPLIVVWQNCNFSMFFLYNLGSLLLTFEVPRDFSRFRRPFSMTSSVKNGSPTSPLAKEISSRICLTVQSSLFLLIYKGSDV